MPFLLLWVAHYRGGTRLSSMSYGEQLRRGRRPSRPPPEGDFPMTFPRVAVLGRLGRCLEIPPPQQLFQGYGPLSLK